MAQRTRELVYEAIGFIEGALRIAEELLVFHSTGYVDPVLETQLLNVMRRGLDRAADKLNKVAEHAKGMRDAIDALTKRINQVHTTLPEHPADLTEARLRDTKEKLTLIVQATEEILLNSKLAKHP